MKKRPAALALLLAISLFRPSSASAQTDPAAPPPESPGPFAPRALPGGGFGVIGQFVISGELQLRMEKTIDGNTTFLVQPALDYFIAPNISVGGVVGLSVSTGDPTVTNVRLGARAGYNLNVAEKISFWPLAGLYVSHYSAGSNSDTGTLLSLFAPFLFHPVAHLFVGLGPFLNLGLSGGGADEFGIQSVVGGWL